MSTLPLMHSVVDAIVADLEAADWQYDPEADDMDIILPHVTNRAADWVQVDDDGCFVRIDLERREPLSIVIIAFTVWLAEKQGRALPVPKASIDYAAARQAIAHTLRASKELAAAVGQVAIPVLHSTD